MGCATHYHNGSDQVVEPVSVGSSYHNDSSKVDNLMYPSGSLNPTLTSEHSCFCFFLVFLWSHSLNFPFVTNFIFNNKNNFVKMIKMVTYY